MPWNRVLSHAFAGLKVSSGINRNVLRMDNKRVPVHVIIAVLNQNENGDNLIAD